MNTNKQLGKSPEDLILEGFLKQSDEMSKCVVFLDPLPVRFGRLKKSFPDTGYEIISDDNYQQIRLRSLDTSRVNMASIRYLVYKYYEYLFYNISDLDFSDSNSHVITFVNTSTTLETLYVKIDRLPNDVFMIQVY